MRCYVVSDTGGRIVAVKLAPSAYMAALLVARDMKPGQPAAVVRITLVGEAGLGGSSLFRVERSFLLGSVPKATPVYPSNTSAPAA